MHTTEENIRPFVCEGNPLDYRVFVVGSNAATPMPFQPYWGANGFDKAQFLKDYDDIRRERGKRGRSPTRQRLDAISANIPCIETNLYPIATESEADIEDGWGKRIFEFLFKEIKPALIWSYGDEAYQFLKKEAKFEKDMFLNADKYGSGILDFVGDAEWHGHPFSCHSP